MVSLGSRASLLAEAGAYVCYKSLEYDFRFLLSPLLLHSSLLSSLDLFPFPAVIMPVGIVLFLSLIQDIFVGK